MAVVWRNGDLKRMSTEIRAKGAGGREAVTEILARTAAEAGDDMRRYIETRGTGYMDRPGRVETGQMLGDVAATDRTNDVVVTGKKVTGKVGWGINGGKVEPYYLYQENGFQQKSGHNVPPMHALLDSFIRWRERVAAEIKEITRSR